MDTKLTFSPHVSNTVSRANRALGLLIRSFQVGTSTSTSKFNQSAVLAAYFANVRSILEYCSVVWAGAANTHAVRVDRVQHKFLIWLLTHASSGRAHSLSYGCLLLHFKIPSLASRRMQHFSQSAASIDPHRLTFYRAQSSSEDSRLWNVQQNSQSYERLSEQHVQPRCLS